MAQPVCSFCDSEYGVLMDTDLIEGDTKVIGASCLPGYALVLAATATTGMSPDIAKQYGQYFDQLAANDTRPKQQRATARSSGHKAAQSSDAANDAEPSTVASATGRSDGSTSAPDTDGPIPSSVQPDIQPPLEDGHDGNDNAGCDGNHGEGGDHSLYDHH